MKGCFPRERDLPRRQIRQMQEFFPLFVPTLTRAGGITWRGKLCPTAESPTYSVTIVHALDRSPSVRVNSPALHPNAPHRYSDGSLCLYWPVEWRWTPRTSLAETMVPWTALWLYYYEIWLVTGEWMGPSSPHGTVRAKEAA